MNGIGQQALSVLSLSLLPYTIIFVMKFTYISALQHKIIDTQGIPVQAF
jgi:hypothetical protein